jgi:type I restriction enzyme R subunit
VARNYQAWMAQQQSAGKAFTPEQQRWLEMIRDHVAANLGVTVEDFEYAPFSQQGGLGRVHQLFGAELPKVLGSLTEALVA